MIFIVSLSELHPVPINTSFLNLCFEISVINFIFSSIEINLLCEVLPRNAGYAPNSSFRTACLIVDLISSSFCSEMMLAEAENTPDNSLAIVLPHFSLKVI